MSVISHFRREYIIDVSSKFHILHGNVKFVVKEYVRLIENRHEFEFQNDHYSLVFTLEKATAANWSELTQRVYGTKVLRFTHRTNGDNGLWIVLRFPQDTVINKAFDSGSIWRTVSFENLTYSFNITFFPSIIEQIKGRCDARTKQMIAKRQQQIADNKKPVKYICHNPKPYQGGKFSSK